MAGTIRDMLTSGSAKPERSKKGVTEAMRNLLLGAEQEQGRRAMEHTEPQRHDVKRLPHYAKQAGLGWLAGVPGYIGDTLNLVQSAADVIPGMGPMRNRPPVGGTTESIGDMLGADTKSGAFQLGAMGAPDMNDVVRLSALLAPITWHGSPHKFAPTDRSVLGEFDSRKIGTGEGAQAYGYGLYLADDADVARSYSGGGKWKGVNAESLPDEAWDEIGAIMRKHDIPGDMMIGVDDAASVRVTMAEFGGKLSPDEKATIAKWAGWPNIYKVDLPDEMIPRMLDWDAPLIEQPDHVKKALRPVFKKFGMDFDDYAARGNDWTDIRDNVFESLNPDEMADVLREAGIPGIKYWDGNSRAAGQGTRNYVVFPGEEGALKILGRNDEIFDAGRNIANQPQAQYQVSLDDLLRRGDLSELDARVYRLTDELEGMHGLDNKGAPLVHVAPWSGQFDGKQGDAIVFSSALPMHDPRVADALERAKVIASERGIPIVFPRSGMGSIVDNAESIKRLGLRPYAQRGGDNWPGNAGPIPAPTGRQRVPNQIAAYWKPEILDRE